MKNFGNVLVLGDSYSTFRGCIPSDNNSYYPNHDVDVFEKTWWGSLIKQTNSNLVLNESYSGSAVSYYGWANLGSELDPIKTSFITRVENLIDKGFFKENKIDTIFVCAGTNDLWIARDAKRSFGEVKYSDIKEEDLYYFYPAFARLLELLTSQIDSENIIILFNDMFLCRPDFLENQIEICKGFNVKYLQLKEIDKTDGHPNANGMQAIKNQIIKAFIEGENNE